MRLIASDPSDYLGSDEVIDLEHPEVQALAHQLRASHLDDADFAQAAFEWVRDEVSHSFDAQDSRVTITASDALSERVGLCYAKSHLLAAVLRAQGVPTGLCYQRLADDATNRAVVHGLVAVHLNNSWHRQDPRGNKPGVDAQFGTDVMPVHAGYQKYRRRLLETGVTLYELRVPTSDHPTRGSGPLGSRGSSLHAKSLAVDVVWVERHPDGSEVRHTDEPDATLGKRLVLGLIGALPIEWLL